MTLALVLPLLSACKSDEKKADELQSSYIEATCRLYSEQACVDAVTAECGFALSFESQEDCELFFALFGSSCAIGEVLLEHEDDADACIAQLEGWACGTDPVCDENGAFLPEQGDCAAISAALSTACDDGDSGT